jgi:catechol 2,3-dioxygenase-like lactoylglutathione lyase family enzyme
VTLTKGLDHIGVLVKDVDRSLAFYGDTLGLKAEKRGNNGVVSLGNCRLVLFPASAQAGDDVGRVLDVAKNPLGLDHLALEVDDIEAAIAELERRGVRFTGPLVTARTLVGARYRGFTDPDGNVLYIIQSPR